MADNVTLSAAIGSGAVIHTDDIGSSIQVQRVKVGQGGDGAYVDVTVNTPLHVEGRIHAIVAGNVTGSKIMFAMGERDSVGTTVGGEDVWHGNELSATPASPASHVYIPFPADAGEQMTIISESDADNGATATGALTVLMDYLDNTGAEQTETLTMNGQAGVDTVATNIRFVQSLSVATVGSGHVAAGHIRIYKKTGNTLVYNMIAAGGNQSLVPHRMVPINKTLYVHEWKVGEKSATKRLTVRIRADCTNAKVPVRQAGVFLFKGTAALDGSAVATRIPFAVPALSVIKASAWAETSGGEVAVCWWGVLEDN